MTIIAWFRVQDGILLCADSMYTGGTKVHQPKLFPFSIGNPGGERSCSFVFALAGHGNFGKMAIEDCVDALSSLGNDRCTMRNVKKALRTAVRQINTEYVDTRPDAAEREASRFDLIIASWLPLAAGLRMFRTSGPAVLPSADYHCTGMGAYLGDYLMRNVFSSSMGLKNAALLAIQALSAAKTYDASCGGDTQFITIKLGGEFSAVVPFDIRTSESYVSRFECISRDMLFDVGNKDMSEVDFETRLEEFTEEIRSIRAMWVGASWDYMQKHIANIIATAKQGPQETTAG